MALKCQGIQIELSAVCAETKTNMTICAYQLNTSIPIYRVHKKTKILKAQFLGCEFWVIDKNVS